MNRNHRAEGGERIADTGDFQVLIFISDCCSVCTICFNLKALWKSGKDLEEIGLRYQLCAFLSGGCWGKTGFLVLV